MDAQQFLGAFSYIASASEGIHRLREIIFFLAATGDLVVGNGVDARPLLDSIREQKANHPDQKRVVPPQRELRAQEFLGPAHWAPCRLGDLVLTITGGGTPSKANPAYWDGDIPWASVKDLKDSKFLEETEDHITNEGLANSSTNLIPAGRVIVSTRMGLGKCVINKITTAINQDLKALELPNEVNIDFFYILYRTKVIKGIGTTVAGIRQEKLLDIPAALPPIDEQQRIVARVDELVALSENLRAQQQQRQRLGERTRITIFQRLGRAKSTHELQASWHRVQTNAPLLIESPESVHSYKGAILDLATSGMLLAPQDRVRTTGSMLLAEIAEARTAWSESAEGQERKEAVAMLKKLRMQDVVAPDLELPEHWAWGSFLQISQAAVDCHNKTAPYVPEGIHLVRTTDIRNGNMDLKHTRKISQDTYTYWARRLPPKIGDVIFTREAPMGEAAIVPGGERICLGQRTMLIRLFPELFNSKFLLYTIYSPSFQERMTNAAVGMTVKHLRVGGVEDLMVPVPPKQEQDRIVAIVDGLLSRCRQLEAQLSNKTDTASKFAKASVEAFTGIRIEDKEKMKAPKTELVSILRMGISPSGEDQPPLTTILARHRGELSAKALWGSSGLEIDAFYQQLKTEMANGWIEQADTAYVKEVEAA